MKTSGDRLDIEFVASGAKTILKSTDLKPALSPSPDFRFPREKNKSRTPRFKVERPPRRPQLDFNHHTNLVFKIEKVKFSDGIKSVEKHNLFANALYDLLHGSGEMEARFTKFSRVVSEIGANNWPIATYFQFLASDGRWMFMKPSAMKRMADSLKIALNYKAQPNWLTYLKLQELANRVDLELRNRNLSPHSGIDVQGFIWTSIQIEEGKYGKTSFPSNGNYSDGGRDLLNEVPSR